MSSSTLTPPVPIVLIGIHTEVGKPVAEGLRPHWDSMSMVFPSSPSPLSNRMSRLSYADHVFLKAVRFIQSFEAAKADLPHLIAGREPPTPPTNSVGSGMGKYDGRPVRAVLLGRGFTQQQGEELRRLCDDDGQAAEPIIWAVGSEANRPKGLPPSAPPPGLAEIVVPVFKGILESWKGEGASKAKIVLY
jgi:hypothetical protein